jgi:hypothetical protein
MSELKLILFFSALVIFIDLYHRLFDLSIGDKIIFQSLHCFFSGCVGFAEFGTIFQEFSHVSGDAVGNINVGHLYFDFVFRFLETNIFKHELSLLECISNSFHNHN